MASQNLNVGTGANANDGDTLRAAFINVRKMFHEIYGISATYSDSLDLSAGGETFAESVQDIIGGMVSGNTEDNIQVTYDDANNKLNFTVAADINDINTEANSGLSGGVDSGDATLTLDLNNLSAGVIDVAADSIAIVDASDSNSTKKESIADVMTAVAGSGLTATSGVLSVDVDDSTVELSASELRVKDNGVTQAKLENRYKGKVTNATTGSQSLNCANASFFHLTGNITTATLTLQNMKAGQSIDILLTGTLSSAAITLDTNFTTDTIYRVGDNEIDTSASNIIQVTCLEDNDGSAKIAYSIATLQVDDTP